MAGHGHGTESYSWYVQVRVKEFLIQLLHEEIWLFSSLYSLSCIQQQLEHFIQCMLRSTVWFTSDRLHHGPAKVCPLDVSYIVLPPSVCPFPGVPWPCAGSYSPYEWSPRNLFVVLRLLGNVSVFRLFDSAKGTGGCGARTHTRKNRSHKFNRKIQFVCNQRNPIFFWINSSVCRISTQPTRLHLGNILPFGSPNEISYHPLAHHLGRDKEFMEAAREYLWWLLGL